MPEIICFLCVLGELGTDEAEFRRKVASGRRVGGAIRSLVNTRGLQLEYARIRAVQMDNLRRLLGIKMVNKFRIDG